MIDNLHNDGYEVKVILAGKEFYNRWVYEESKIDTLYNMVDLNYVKIFNGMYIYILDKLNEDICWVIVNNGDIINVWNKDEKDN